MKIIRTFMTMLMLVSYNVAFSQNYTLYSSYLPVEYQKDGNWYKVRRDETKLNNNTYVRCKSDFTIQEIGGAKGLHFCSSAQTGKRLEELISTSVIKKIQTVVTSWFRSGTAYEIAEADSPTSRDSIDNTPYNLHYILVDVHSFDDNTWGDLGLPNVDLDTLDHSIQLNMVPNGNYCLKTRKVLYSPQNTTADSICWHLDDLVKQVNEDQKNLVILYLSSHGERSSNNEFCFITTDSKYDFINRGGITHFISGKEINNYVRQLVEKHSVVLVFLDACYAGMLFSELDKNDVILDGSVAYFMSTEGDLKAYQDSYGSPFVDALTKAMSNEEQLYFRGNGNVVSPYMLGQYIHDVVNKQHKGQNPKTERGSGIGAEYGLWRIKPKMSRNLIDDLRTKAGEGETDAMVELGDIYYKGNEELNITADFSKAYNYYKVAFDKGNIKACAKVGLCYYYGKGVAQDNVEALRYFSVGSYDADDLAKYYLGVCYAKGIGTKINKKKSKKTLLEIEKWYDDEIVAAMETEKINIPGVVIVNNDGFLSHSFGPSFGEKVPIRFYAGTSDGNSPEYVELLAENGNAKAQAAIGMIYLYGFKEKKIDYNKAVFWLKKAAAAGIASAIYNLGYCYAKGFGVKMDSQKAWSNYKKAAEKGYSSAFVTIGNYYFFGSAHVLQNDRDAADNWKKAAEKGNIIGLYKFGLCYKYGIGVEQNNKESIRWITKSAKKGYDRAQYELGNYYFFNKDYKKAYKWFEKSKIQGNKAAKEMIDHHYYLDGKLRPLAENQ